MGITKIDEAIRAGRSQQYISPGGDDLSGWHTVEEFASELDRRLSEHFGVDFAKLSQMVDSGELMPDEVSDALMDRPEFKYEPHSRQTDSPDL
ncbi:MAG: hypothetical protein LBI58_05295 [Tannerellaceae bacterium]|jgi:hypothetical protein|nr:hypothetical protein [Tannerellaceae bacterium]